MKRIGILSAALLTAGVLWADNPTITLSRVQQRYPWNGMVDIDFSISGVDDSNNYFVRFKLVKDGGSPFVLHEFLNDKPLYAPVSEGDQRVTWNSAWEDSEYRFFSTNVTLQAELVYCAGNKSNTPYGARYAIIDLSEGSSASSYSVTYTNIHYTIDATTRETTATDVNLAAAVFTNGEYKTNKLVMRRVRSGMFDMGSPADEPFREPSPDGTDRNTGYETQHAVTLTKNFWLGIYELTAGQLVQVSNTWELKTNKGAYPASGNITALTNVVNGGGANVTYTLVTNSVIAPLSARSGLTFTLPTEAQWEYACRAGTKTALWNGECSSNNLNDIAVWWYKPGSSKWTPSVVGSRDPNPWGFYDMIGNVSECCRDTIIHNRYYGFTSSNDVVAVVDPVINDVNSSGLIHYARGGCYYDGQTDVGGDNPIGFLRAGARGRYMYESKSEATRGFRLCVEIP